MFKKTRCASDLTCETLHGYWGPFYNCCWTSRCYSGDKCERVRVIRQLKPWDPVWFCSCHSFSFAVLLPVTYMKITVCHCFKAIKLQRILFLGSYNTCMITLSPSGSDWNFRYIQWLIGRLMVNKFWGRRNIWSKCINEYDTHVYTCRN
jgi:hypothetical protein